MDVSKSSWHYRLISFFVPPPANLCLYFWAFVLSLTVGPAILAFYPLGPSSLKMFNIATTTKGYSFVAESLTEKLTIEGPRRVTLLAVTGIFMPFVLIVVLLFFLSYFVARAGKVPKKPSLALAWLSAKKNRVCPLLRFTD